ncbi:MAG: fdtB [Candidatus Paceibacter sp.]|nr:fdtB [Candidatus Paceibacter sp.]
MSKSRKFSKENLGVGCFEVPANAKKYINQVLDTKRISYGPFIQKFEKEFSHGHQAKFGIMVNSGTSALRIAVACLKETEHWKKGDEVLVPAVTFVATSNVVIDHDLTPVFVDVDPLTYNIDPTKIEEKITPRTKCIMVVHLFGQPADMGPIMEIAKKHKLKVIEDSCETMYAKYEGKSVGSFGDIACFSTYVAHLIVTGVGGVAVTNNKKYAEILRSLANHGRDGIYISIDDDKGKKGKELNEVIARRFKFIRPGYSFRVTEMEGALGVAQLEVSAKSFVIRKKNAEYLLEKLRPLSRYIQLPWNPPFVDHVFMMFPLVIKDEAGVEKAELTSFLEEKGIETRDMLPLINQPFMIERFGLQGRDFPVADWINNYGFYIGCHQQMGQAELDYIVDCFFEFYKNQIRPKVKQTQKEGKKILSKYLD